MPWGEIIFYQIVAKFLKVGTLGQKGWEWHYQLKEEVGTTGNFLQFLKELPFIVACNLMIEQKTRVKDNSPKESQEESHKTEELSLEVSIAKHVHRSKREALKEKKKAKGKALQSDEIDTEQASNRAREDEAASVTSQDAVHPAPLSSNPISNRPSINLTKLIAKPPYLLIKGSKTFVGSFGHSSVVFKKPVLEGSYYIEFRLKEDAKKDKPCTYPSAARVGICLPSFDPAFPLGCGNSIAYKSGDGSIVRQNDKIGTAEPWKSGDVVGVCLRVRPPRKHPEPEREEEGSVVQFLKNGKSMCVVGPLRQEFYCFGVSLFNYSQLEVVCEGQGTFEKYDGQNYLSGMEQKVPYKDLQSSKIFKL